jgi:hypothetical protein
MSNTAAQCNCNSCEAIAGKPEKEGSVRVRKKKIKEAAPPPIATHERNVLHTAAREDVWPARRVRAHERRRAGGVVLVRLSGLEAEKERPPCHEQRLAAVSQCTANNGSDDSDQDKRIRPWHLFLPHFSV